MARMLAVLACVVAAAVAQQGPPPIMSKAEVWPDRDRKVVATPGYPGFLPFNRENVWTINGVPGSTITLHCQDVTLQNMFGMADCSMGVVVVDGENAGKFCNSFQVTSRESTLMMVVPTYNNVRARVSCVATSSLNGRPMPYYLAENQFTDNDINSNEHGVRDKPARKKTSCNCGWTNKKKQFGRIVGGSETQVNEYPLTAALVDITNPATFHIRPDYMRFCGGTIITEWHVLTAAHCTFDHINDKRKVMAVILGDHDHTRNDITPDKLMYFVDKIVNHEQYDHNTTQFDIALIKTAVQIKFSDRVGPACLPKGPMNLVKQFVKGVGWGMTADPGNPSNVLKKTWIQVMSLETCSPLYPSYKINMQRRHQLCVFGKQRGLCMGDSGGPVLWHDTETNRYTLVGVVSFGRRCSDFYPDIVTEVSALLPWINQKVAATMPAKTCSAL